MQVDHIDKNTIRVRIDKAELARRGMGMLDLLGNRQRFKTSSIKFLMRSMKTMNLPMVIQYHSSNA